MPDHPLEALANLDGVADAVARARASCEELRWHRGLRRTWAVARTEAGIRCAHSGGLVDGVRLPLGLARDVARGAADAPGGPDGAALLAALRVQSEVERQMAAPGAVAPRGDLPFGQLVSRLHLAATAGPSSSEPGRPRSAAQPRDLRGLGPAPVGEELAVRLTALGDLTRLPPDPSVSAVVTAAVVHGEMLTLRPFDHANGPVARALFRHQLTVGGVDPVGVVVAEARWAREPTVYLSAAAGFATGTPEGVAAWLRYCARSVVVGAEEGTAVADSVLAGRLRGAG